METAWIVLERNAERGLHWQVRQINGSEISEWRKGQSYCSVESYCEEQVQKEGWKNAAVDCGENDASITFWR